MGRYQTEAAYLKSVLLWLQGNWTEPDPPRLYWLRAVPQVSPHCSTRRIHGALNRRDGIVDLPAFLPPRNHRNSAKEKLSIREDKITVERTVASRRALNNLLRSAHDISR